MAAMTAFGNDAGDVEAASSVLARFLDRDERLRGSPDSYVYRRKMLRKTRYIDVPQDLLEYYDHLSSRSFMGLLPEISRAYITIDNKLFLWNYQDGSYYAYDELAQIIISVGLVNPKPGVFVDDIEFLLVLATPVEIVLLGVRFDGGTVYGDIEIVPTSYVVSSDNVHMLKIVGTPKPSSRIFMCGKDGCVYELDYRPGSRWFSRKCRKINHGTMGSKIYQLLPIPFLRGPDPIVDMVIDDSNGVMYTLTKASTIMSYSLGSELRQCQGPTYIVDLERHVQAKESVASSGKASGEFRIVALCLPDPSSRHALLAVTNHCHRIFMTRKDGNLIVSGVHICPRYVAAPYADTERDRFKPYFANGHSPEMIRHALCFNGTFIAADMRDPEFDTLIGIVEKPQLAAADAPQHSLGKFGRERSEDGTASSSAKTVGLTQASIDENVESHMLEARVHDIREQSDDFYLASPVVRSLYASKGKRPLGGLSPFATQHALPPRQFLVLSSMRMSVFSQLRPVDELRELLREGVDHGRIQEFFALYSPPEACAMCLVLICSSPAWDATAYSGDGSSFDNLQDRSQMDGFDASAGGVQSIASVSAHVKQVAIDVFHNYGGAPHYARHDPGTVLYSARHDALYAFMSRLLRSVWQWSVLDEKDPNTPGLCKFRFEPQLWRLFLAPLLHLDRFLQDFPQSRFYASRTDGSDDPAIALEIRSLARLQSTLNRAIEVLRLLILIADNVANVSRLAAHIDPPELQALYKLPFSNLTGTRNGARALQALIRAFMEEQQSVDPHLIDSLYQASPSFVDAADTMLFQGNRLLRVAHSSESVGVARQRRLEREAIENFKRAAVEFNFPLRSTLNKLQERGLFRGIVEVCLHRASVLRSSEIELATSLEQQTRGGRRSTTPVRLDTHAMTMSADDLRLRIKATVGKRHECYQAIVHRMEEIDVSAAIDASSSNLSNRSFSGSISKEDRPDSVLQAAMHENGIRDATEACMGSNDEEFLHQFWFHSYKDRSRSYSYEIECPAFERFLRSQYHYHDRLLLYFTRLGMFLKAALYFRDLCFDDGSSGVFSLLQRSRFLEIAIDCTKSLRADEDPGLIFELRRAHQLVDIQQAVLNHIGHSHADDAAVQRVVDRLQSSLLDSEELYNTASEYRCYEACLDILYLEDAREHADVINTFWSNIIQVQVLRRESLHKDWRMVVREKVGELGRRFRDTRFMFPIEHIASLLERLNVSRTSSAVADPSFIIPLFVVDVGVAVDSLIPVYSNLVRQFSGDRTTVFMSVLQLLSQESIARLALHSAAYHRAIDDGIDLVDLCLNYEPEEKEKFILLREWFANKRALL